MSFYCLHLYHAVTLIIQSAGLAPQTPRLFDGKKTQFKRERDIRRMGTHTHAHKMLWNSKLRALLPTAVDERHRSNVTELTESSPKKARCVC